ncbi:MAG TPA: hypothetical protein VIM69_00105 [Opitutaceae bacterium]
MPALPGKDSSFTGIARVAAAQMQRSSILTVSAIEIFHRFEAVE